MYNKIKLLVYPNHRRDNPYLELLNSNLPKNEIIIKYLPYKIFGVITLANFIFPVSLIFYRILGFKTLHIHWLSYMESPINIYPINLLFELYFLFLILFIKLLRYNLIWTMHDLVRNSRRFIHTKFIIKFLITHSDICVAHNKSTIIQMQNLSYPTNNSLIIPHGSYYGEYKQNIIKKEARKQLNIKDRDFVFLFFGRLAWNKGIDRLLDSFSNLKVKNIKLIIAGKIEDEKLKKLLDRYTNNSNILLYRKFVPNDEVQVFFKASDILVYPAEKVTTSGSLLLAFSFGLSAIIPSEGPIDDIPKNCIYIYNNNHPDSLFKIMKDCYYNKIEVRDRGINASHYIRQFSWQNMAKKTHFIYKKLNNYNSKEL